MILEFLRKHFVKPIATGANLTLEFIRKYSVYVLAIGASLIIGFLSFSGMYVLVPLLPVAIVAFGLSVIYEGQIFRDNIINAFNKLFNLKYYEEQLAKESLRKLLPVIEEKERLQSNYMDVLAPVLGTLDDLIKQLKEKKSRNELKNLYKRFTQHYEKFKDLEKNNTFIGSLEDSMLSDTDFETCDDSDVIDCLEDILSKLHEHDAHLNDTPPFFNHFINLLQIYHQYDKPNLSGYDIKPVPRFWKAWLNKRTIHISQKDGKIAYSLITPDGREINEHLTDIEAPNPFTSRNIKELKAEIIAIARQNKHAQADDRDDKEQIKQSIQTLEQLFIDQLFDPSKAPDPNKQASTHTEKYIASLHEFFDKSFALKELSEKEFITLQEHLNNKKNLLKWATQTNYKTILFTAQEKIALRKALTTEEPSIQLISKKLVDKSHREIWHANAKTRRFAFRSTQVLSGIAALFMMLGTSFLLVEAFSIFPFMATLSFGFWPIFIVPMAIIAGFAFGLLTFNAITDMINDDIILERYRKLKADWNKGLTFKSGLMLVTTVSLIALAIALTICTAGTWWTVIKYTRPIFAFMRKIPIAVVGIAAAILGLATFAFNTGNTLETLKELDEEMGDDSNPETSEHPYDLKLKELDKNDNATNIDLNTIECPTLIKQGSKYWVIGSPNGKPWEIKALKDHCFDHLNFKQPYLRYSWRNLSTYLIIKQNNAHTFIPSRENWRQRINPFRLILKLTYTPLRIVLFLGHLVSIGVTADRLPGIPEILSALLGIISEFFEDWHYFFSIKHKHKHTSDAVYDEYNGKEGEHDHEDDLPTQLLRKVFSPLIYLAAWWDSAHSDYKDSPDGLGYDEDKGKEGEHDHEDDLSMRLLSRTFYLLIDAASWLVNALSNHKDSPDSLGAEPKPLKKHNKKVSFEEAFDHYSGLPPRESVSLNNEHSDYINMIKEMANASKKPNNATTNSIKPETETETETETYEFNLISKLAASTYDGSKKIRLFSNSCYDSSCLRSHDNPMNKMKYAGFTQT